MRVIFVLYYGEAIYLPQDSVIFVFLMALSRFSYYTVAIFQSSIKSTNGILLFFERGVEQSSNAPKLKRLTTCKAQRRAFWLGQGRFLAGAGA
jgi:hypothetical protein